MYLLDVAIPPRSCKQDPKGARPPGMDSKTGTNSAGKVPIVPRPSASTTARSNSAASCTNAILLTSHRKTVHHFLPRELHGPKQVKHPLPYDDHLTTPLKCLAKSVRDQSTMPYKRDQLAAVVPGEPDAYERRGMCESDSMSSTRTINFSIRSKIRRSSVPLDLQDALAQCTAAFLVLTDPRLCRTRCRQFAFTGLSDWRSPIPYADNGIDSDDFDRTGQRTICERQPRSIDPFRNIEVIHGVDSRDNT